MNYIRKHAIFLFVLAVLILLLSITAYSQVPDFANIILEPAKADGAAYIQGNDEYQRVPENIIREPDFEKVRDLPTDSLDYQLSEKVGWIIIPHPSYPGGYLYCTGFLVGPDLFMTNHHCIHDNFGALPLEGVYVFMAYYQEPSVDSTRGGISAGVSAVLSADATKDYALLRLDTPIGNTLGWLTLDTTTHTPDTRQSVKLISHNRARSKEIVRNNTEIVEIPVGHPLSHRPFAIAYLADTEDGSSGSPVFLRDGSNVIGIHHSAWNLNHRPHFNAGSLMSYIVPEIQQWLPSDNAPDVASGIPSLSTDWAMPGDSVTLIVSAVNQGTAASTPTTLRVYQSDDSEITATDVEIGTSAVGALSPSDETEFSIVVSAPALEGVYYYGACVDAVSSDPRTDNDCSASVILTVSTEPEPIKMYWTHDGVDQIQRSNLDGSNVRGVVGGFQGLYSPVDIAVDMEGGKIYWADEGTNNIHRANLDGTHIEDVVTRLGRPSGVALDLQNEKVYWSNLDTKTIQRSNLDGTHIEDVIVDDYRPVSIALDLHGGKIYWVGQSLILSNRFKRADLDGTNIETLVMTGYGLIGGIALDLFSQKMYWTASPFSGTRKIQRSNLDGTNIETLVEVGVEIPLGIALHVDAGKMYWTDQGTRSIARAHLDGSNVETLITDLNFPAGIALGIIPEQLSSQPPEPEPPIEPPTEPVSNRLDVNGDGLINVLDLVWVALYYGQRGNDLAADVNQDGIVNVQDFTAVAEAVDAETLPEYLIEAALLDIEAIAGAPIFNHNEVLQQLLSLLSETQAIPETTALLPNYPNPFNPETWIPYQLAKSADVSITIYAVNGQIVRHLPIGYREAGIYRNKHRSVYWDGRTEKNEPAASGIYFYTLTTGKKALTRKMLIRK